MGQDHAIRQIDFVSEDMGLECYYIASQFVGDAECLFYSLQYNVNVLGHQMFVCVNKGFIQGFIKGEILKPTTRARIDELYVDRRCHGRGIGTSLLNAYCNYAADCGVREVVLWSRPTVAAKAFYNARGFRLVGASRLMQKTL